MHSILVILHAGDMNKFIVEIIKVKNKWTFYWFGDFTYMCLIVSENLFTTWSIGHKSVIIIICEVETTRDVFFSFCDNSYF